jgi:hypothetical protein
VKCKMSNVNSINLDFCAISNLKHNVLTAYPLFLVLGVPLKTVSGILYEKKSFFKIESYAFEQWFETIYLAFKKMDSDEQFSELIVKERDFEYRCSLDTNKKQLNIVLSQPDIEDLCFLFDITELKLFLLAFSDLILYAYCLPDNVMETYSQTRL